MKFNTSHHGRVLNKPDFWEVFTLAWNTSMVAKHVISGFRKTGIYPHDPAAIPESAMAPSEITD